MSRTSFLLRHATFPTQFVEESRNFNKLAFQLKTVQKTAELYSVSCSTRLVLISFAMEISCFSYFTLKNEGLLFVKRNVFDTWVAVTLN